MSAEQSRFAPPADLPFQVRALLRGRNAGFLGTLMTGGAPYVSLVTLSTTADGEPLFLLSHLADHTRNLLADARASLLVSTDASPANPQQGARISLQGRIEKSDDPAHRARFLARHPGAALYADFADFAFFRMRVEAVHWVGGFARAHWLPDFPAAPLLTDAVTDWPSEFLPSLLQQAGVTEKDGWQISGHDADGLEIRRDNIVIRVTFSAPCVDFAAMQDEVLTGKVRYWRN